MADVLRPDQIDFAAYIRETEAKQKVRPAAEYVDELIESRLAVRSQQVRTCRGTRRTACSCSVLAR